MSNPAPALLNICAFFVRRLLPQTCHLCGATAGENALCVDCRDNLPYHLDPSCPVCALPVPGGQTCGACLRRPPSYDRVLAPFDYAFPLDVLVHRLKYAARLSLAPLLADALAERVAGAPRPDLLLPMPLHPARLRQRGYNQALELARHLARRLRLPLDADSCQRLLDTAPQAALSWRERRRNVRRAFVCRRDLIGLHVALIDDVMTSGATVEALARAVRRAGAREISVWVAARTLKKV